MLEMTVSFYPLAVKLIWGVFWFEENCRNESQEECFRNNKKGIWVMFGHP